MCIDERPVNGQRHAARAAKTAPIDTELLGDFIDLLGVEQSARWLDKFCVGLANIFPQGADTVHDPAISRPAIHNLCAQAGLIGLTALHKSCLGYLELPADHARADAAYERVREEAQHAMTEIARQRILIQ